MCQRINNFFASLLLLVTVCSVSATAQYIHHADRPAVHGMVIFGNEKIYAYHLPMFDAPHNYQVILELTFDAETLRIFKRDQQLNPEHATYTIEPEKFVLPEMLDNPRPFRVNIYRGHFERGGVKIITGAVVQIADVKYSNLLDASRQKGQMQFFVFGNTKEQYAVHVLTNKPDFDQIIQVSLDLAMLKDQKYVTVNFPALENSPIGVSGNAVNGFLTDRPIKIILLRQLYLEFDDLRAED
jgi:hypothetical protein